MTSNNSSTVLVTGATGFVGRYLCSRLLEEHFRVRGTLLETEDPASLVEGVEPVIIEPLSADTEWSHALDGVDIVIHLAARVHIMNDPSADPLIEFRKVNVDGTARLARCAVASRVNKFVFVSSIKVNGEECEAAYSPDSPPNPIDPYGMSKWEAEQALREIELHSGLNVVVVRPTLVYGPGVKANFLHMMNIVRLGIPLPFSLTRNKRSLIYVGNLVDALVTCAIHPRAAGRTYMVSDNDDVSTHELVRRIASALGVPARLFPFPVIAMKVLGVLSGRSGMVDRLCGSLTVDCSSIRDELGWVPPFSMEDGLLRTVAWYRDLRHE